MEMFCLEAVAAVGVFLTWRQWRYAGNRENLSCENDRKSKFGQYSCWSAGGCIAGCFCDSEMNGLSSRDSNNVSVCGHLKANESRFAWFRICDTVGLGSTLLVTCHLSDSLSWGITLCNLCFETNKDISVWNLNNFICFLWHVSPKPTDMKLLRKNVSVSRLDSSSSPNMMLRCSCWAFSRQPSIPNLFARLVQKCHLQLWVSAGEDGWIDGLIYQQYLRVIWGFFLLLVWGFGCDHNWIICPRPSICSIYKQHLVWVAALFYSIARKRSQVHLPQLLCVLSKHPWATLDWSLCPDSLSKNSSLSPNHNFLIWLEDVVHLGLPNARNPCFNTIQIL